MSDDLPALLRGFDPEVLRRMEGQAETIADALLRRRTVPRPRQWREDVYFPRGTTEFQLLHRMADDPDVLFIVLDRAVQRQTAGDAEQWCLSPIDEALCNQYDGWTAFMLHPANLIAEDLAEVPPEVLIYQINRQAPYEVAESPPCTPRQIAYFRENRHAGLQDRKERWQNERLPAKERLVNLIRAELRRQRPNLTDEVASTIDGLIAEAMRHRHSGAWEELFRAASYLGIFERLSGGFAETEE